jgi:hypothetical protein
MYGMINFSSSNLFLAVFWMSGFVILTFNVGYMLISSFISFVMKDEPLKEKDLSILPPTAIIYVVRNEEEEVLLNSMYRSFRDNFRDSVDLWLLSNSDLEEYVDGKKGHFDLERVFWGRTGRVFPDPKESFKEKTCLHSRVVSCASRV